MAVSAVLAVSACADSDSDLASGPAIPATEQARPALSPTDTAVFNVSAIEPEMDLVDFARDLIKSVEGADPKVRHLTRGKLGHSAKHAREHGRYVAAALLVEHGLAMLEKSSLATAERLAAERAELADLYRRLGRFSDANTNFRAAINLKRQTRPSDHEAIIDLLYPFALNHADRGRYDNAEFLLNRILDQSPPDDAGVIPVLIRLAEIYRLDGRYDDAEAQLRRALRIARQHPMAVAGDGGLVRAIYHGLGKLHQARGQFADAERLFRYNVESDEARKLAGDPRLSHSRNSLGELYLAQNRLEEAIGQFDLALGNLEKRLGPPPPMLATIANNLANAFTRQGKFDEAKTMFRRAIAIMRASIGAEHPDYAAVLLDIAAWFEAQNQPEDANVFGKRAAEIYARAFGNEHPKTAAVRGKYPETQASLGEAAGNVIR
jgi:tetratricopeptide (TPR) repeat protein